RTRNCAARRNAAPCSSKPCADCGRDIPAELLKKLSGGRLGNICKPCDAARARARYWHDVQATRRRRRELRARDPETKRRQSRECYRRHLESNRARGRAYARSDRGRTLNRQAVARWQARNPKKVAAHVALRAAVKRGKVKRMVCEVVDCKRTDRLHGHHL